MLQSIRDRSQGWLTWIIVIVICVMFALFGINYYLSGSVNTQQVVAKVNNISITAKDVSVAYQRVSDSQNTSTDSTVLRQEVINSLIVQQVLTQAAQKSGFYVSEEQVDQMLLTIPAFQENGQFSEQRFHSILQMLGYSLDQLRAEAGQSIIRDQVRYGITDSEFLLPSELNDVMNLLSQTRSIGYFVVNGHAFTKQINITDANIQKYYQTHQADFELPERVSLDYVLLSKADLAKQQTVSDAEIQTYYQQNKATLKLPLDAVKDQVIAAVKQQKADQAYVEIGSKLSELAYENPSSLSFANQLNLPIQQSPVFSLKGGDDRLTSNAQVIKAAFSDTVRRDGNNSDIINLSDSQAVVVRLHQDYPASHQALETVKSEIQKMLLLQAEQSMAISQANVLAKALQQSHDPLKLQQQYGLNWQVVNQAARDSKQVDKSLLASAFAAPLPVKGRPVVGIVALGNGDVGVFSVLDVTNSISNNPEMTGVYDKILLPLLAELAYEQYVNASKANASIEVMEK